MPFSTASFPMSAACTNDAIVCVFPVPGGPWIKTICLDAAVFDSTRVFRLNLQAEAEAAV